MFNTRSSDCIVAASGGMSVPVLLEPLEEFEIILHSAPDPSAVFIFE